MICQMGGYPANRVHVNGKKYVYLVVVEWGSGGEVVVWYPASATTQQRK